MTAERRRYPRIPAAWPVRVGVGQDLVVGQTIDVSQYGLCVITAPTGLLKEGNCYRVEVVASMGEEVVVLGSVRHIGQRGIGIETTEPIPGRLIDSGSPSFLLR